MKLRPKSCSCEQCKSRGRPRLREAEERAFRRQQHQLEKRVALLEGEPNFEVAPYGDYRA